jgi:hypothetical protein
MKTIDYPKPIVDPVMAEVRRHKEEIAASFDYDVIALCRALQEREAGDSRVMTPKEFQISKDQTK